MGIEDDIDGIFQCLLTISSDEEYINLDPHFKLANKDLEGLINNRKASVSIQIYCNGTFYRNEFTSETLNVQEIKIHSYKLKGKTEIDFFICACTDIPDYTNSGWHADYNGNKFYIEKGDILAYGGKAIYYANKSPEELKSVASLMIVRNSGKKLKHFYLDYEGERITVFLPDTDFDIYQILKQYPFYIQILHSNLVFPALIEVLNFYESKDSEEYSEHTWHKLISDKMDKHQDVNNLVTAQKILNYPMNRSFSTMEELIENE